MADSLVFIIILLALAIGFALGRFPISRRGSAAEGRSESLSEHHFQSLTYLLKDDPDEAIDRFITDMEVTPETLEVHLSLGGLLRRKGEFARAIKVHENLLSHRSLASDDANFVAFELAKDYMECGLLDRAESALRDLASAKHSDQSLQRRVWEALVDVYQQTQDWLQAIDIADRLTEAKFASKADRWRIAQAHFCCELAMLVEHRATSANADSNARDNLERSEERKKWLKSALRYDRDCVRASLQLAEMDMEANITHAALATLKKIPLQNDALSSEMIPPLCECYRLLNEDKKCLNELGQYLSSHCDLQALKLLFELSLETEGFRSALTRISQFMPRYQGMDGASALCDVLQANPDTLCSGQFNEVLRRFFDLERHYECVSCGFMADAMHWLCPSCHSWASLRLKSYPR